MKSDTVLSIACYVVSCQINDYPHFAVSYALTFYAPAHVIYRIFDNNALSIHLCISVAET